ncbi:MAG: hypothetical protein HPY85_12730 [Anaerolineae bacterium]|nr:hypothetical protein [Anaerolineae bacterium]
MNLLQKIIDKVPRPMEPALETEELPRSILSSRGVVPLTLGMCADGLPVRIDLADPELQPIAVISDDAQDNTLLFRHVIASLLADFQAEDVQFALLKRRATHFPDLLAAAEERGLMLSLDSIHPRREWEFLYQAAELAEQRHQGVEECRPPLVILVEDLSILGQASSDFRLNFEWLCLYGPAVGVQVVCALTSQDALRMGRWLRYFPVRILGPVSSAYSQRFGLHDPLPPLPRGTRFAKAQGAEGAGGTVFAVWSSTEWLYFHLNRERNRSQAAQEILPGEDE